MIPLKAHYLEFLHSEIVMQRTFLKKRRFIDTLKFDTSYSTEFDTYKKKKKKRRSYLEETRVKGRNNLVQAMGLRHLPIPEEDDGLQ